MNHQVMELRALRAENSHLKNILEAMKAQSEKDKAMELFLAHALSGYCSQHEAVGEKGPEWAASQALKAMNCLLLELESMIRLAEKAGVAPEPENMDSEPTEVPSDAILSEAPTPA